MQAALLGMPNCGKSSIYRLLTGKNVPTGNRSGVTVNASNAPITGSGGNAILTDLPGVRSHILRDASEDERVTLRYLSSGKPDLLVAVADATDLARQIPVIRSLLCTAHTGGIFLVLNFCDELERFPEAQPLSTALGLPVFPVSAKTGRGIPELKNAILSFARNGRDPAPASSCMVCGILNGAEQKLSAALAPVSARRERFSKTFDRFLLCPAIGVPLFFLLMGGILFLTFGAPGEWLCEESGKFLLTPFTSLIRKWIDALSAFVPEWICSLFADGILGGVGIVFSFLPRLLLLFLFQILLEQTGALARFSRLFDPLFRRAGLRGDAVIPLLLGFGCSVPAILCTRGMKDADARNRCAKSLPLVACSARMPLCFLISEHFFHGSGWLICACIWLFSGCCFLLSCRISFTFSRVKSPPEQHNDPLPRWRIPAWHELLRPAFEEIGRFLRKASGTILLCSLLIRLLSCTRPGVAGPVPAAESLLALSGKALAPLFAPLGFRDWRLISALLAGIGAKEATLAALAVLFGGTGSDLNSTLFSSGVLTPASALSFLTFYILYFPCVATIGSMRRSDRRMLLWVLPAAYLTSFLVYRILCLF